MTIIASEAPIYAVERWYNGTWITLAVKSVQWNAESLFLTCVEVRRKDHFRLIERPAGTVLRTHTPTVNWQRYHR